MITELRNCPECATPQPREKLQNCGSGSCDSITCPECHTDHIINYHNDPRPLEDDEWEMLEE
jgi:endogenous inhibitor of DNA gyrase (YacG/DUF329 family)